MARTVTIEGQQYKRRNIVAVWLGLPLITLGIYHVVWIYKVNDEARRYLRDESIKPWMTVLAWTLGVFILVPPFISLYRTCARVQLMEQRAGLTSTLEPVLGLILGLVGGFHTLYIQSHLNHIWDAVPVGGAPAGQPAPALVAPPG